MSIPPYAVNQQSASLTAASITGITAAMAVPFMTANANRAILSMTSTLDQAAIVLKNGVFWHYFGAGSSTPTSAVWDLWSNNQYIANGDVFSVYTAASVTSGSIYGMAS